MNKLDPADFFAGLVLILALANGITNLLYQAYRRGQK